jgi:hypothetical protein
MDGSRERAAWPAPFVSAALEACIKSLPAMRRKLAGSAAQPPDGAGADAARAWARSRTTAELGKLLAGAAVGPSAAGGAAAGGAVAAAAAAAAPLPGAQLVRRAAVAELRARACVKGQKLSTAGSALGADPSGVISALMGFVEGAADAWDRGDGAFAEAAPAAVDALGAIEGLAVMRHRVEFTGHQGLLQALASLVARAAPPPTATGGGAAAASDGAAAGGGRRMAASSRKGAAAAAPAAPPPVVSDEALGVAAAAARALATLAVGDNTMVAKARGARNELRAAPGLVSALIGHVTAAAAGSCGRGAVVVGGGGAAVAAARKDLAEASVLLLSKIAFDGAGATQAPEPTTLKALRDAVAPGGSGAAGASGLVASLERVRAGRGQKGLKEAAGKLLGLLQGGKGCRRSNRPRSEAISERVRGDS